ncbi:hypothetical protein Q5H93_08385 [Hymenobacter sp. ASUV-10]|uniref:Uncharacterized protein n=1 Tax=Hymenobacter aranciens TaxID=3063996 RepID=A0ABT9B901_9BACT|nr:hypothetical protein [Hymenobacter sp. ASUV-10]MDO7874747.1 hypothetical protein [Hymenobacter sp. ASUV-10]
MTYFNFAAHFQYPQALSKGAWSLAVALIGQADFLKSELRLEVSITQLFSATEDIPYTWLQKITGRACEFSLATYDSADFEEADVDCRAMFLNVGYRANPSRIVAELNPGARTMLLQLQQGIHQLYQQGKLQPASLTAHMKTLTPLTVFKMKRRRNRQLI